MWIVLFSIVLAAIAIVVTVFAPEIRNFLLVKAVEWEEKVTSENPDLKKRLAALRDKHTS